MSPKNKNLVTHIGETPFEAIKHTDEQGEYWLARELMPLIAYDRWQNFESVIDKAKVACQNSNIEIEKHFLLTSVKNENPDGKGRPGIDYKLTRYACYLIAQNGSSSKPEIALAQTYFAIQTRKQELAELEKLELERRSIRESTSENYKTMTAALQKTRQRQGKETLKYHYVNEANLVNQIALDKKTKDLQSLAGQKNFRDVLSKEALFNVDIVEAGNTWFIAQGIEYQDRKTQLAAGKPNLEAIDDGNRFLPMFNSSALLKANAQQGRLEATSLSPSNSNGLPEVKGA